MGIQHLASEGFNRRLNRAFDDAEFDDLAQFPSEAPETDFADEPTPWRPPARATQPFVFERRRVVRKPQPQRHVINVIERDRAPHYLLNGFTTVVAVAGAILLAFAGIRGLAAIYPNEGLPRVAAPAPATPGPVPPAEPSAAVDAPAPVRTEALPARPSVAPVRSPAGALRSRPLRQAATPIARPAGKVSPAKMSTEEVARIRRAATERAAIDAAALTASLSGSGASLDAGPNDAAAVSSR